MNHKGLLNHTTIPIRGRNQDGLHSIVLEKYINYSHVTAGKANSVHIPQVRNLNININMWRAPDPWGSELGLSWILVGGWGGSWCERFSISRAFSSNSSWWPSSKSPAAICLSATVQDLFGQG